MIVFTLRKQGLYIERNQYVRLILISMMFPSLDVSMEVGSLWWMCPDGRNGFRCTMVAFLEDCEVSGAVVNVMNFFFNKKSYKN